MPEMMTAKVMVISDSEKGIKTKILKVRSYSDYVRAAKKVGRHPELKGAYDKKSSRHAVALIRELEGWMAGTYELVMGEHGSKIVTKAVTVSSPKNIILGLFDDGFLHDTLPDIGLKVKNPL